MRTFDHTSFLCGRCHPHVMNEGGWTYNQNRHEFIKSSLTAISNSTALGAEIVCIDMMFIMWTGNLPIHQVIRGAAKNE